MVDFIKGLGTLLFIAGIIAGIFLLTKATENIDYVIGVSIIIQGIIFGAVFHFFSNMLLNSESQTSLLKDIRDNFYSDKNKDRANLKSVNDNEKIICKECETVNNSDSNYCINCGANLKDVNPDE